MKTTNNFTKQELKDTLVMEAYLQGSDVVRRYKEDELLEAAKYYEEEYGTLENMCEDVDAFTYERLASEIRSTLLRFELI